MRQEARGQLEPGAMARARHAMLDVANMEINGYGSRQRLYETSLHAYHEAHPGLPAEEVASACYAEIRRHIWLIWGKERGVPEEDCGVGRTYFWVTASRLGFTTPRYAKYDVDDELTSEQDDANSLIAEEERRGEPEAPPGSAECRAAILSLREALAHVYALLRTHDAEEMLGRAEVETLATEASAIAQNIRDMASEQRLVPASLHVMFALTLAAVATADALARRICAAIASRDLDSRAMTRKGMANITRSRYKRVPLCMEPRRLVVAAMRGYHGARCPKCGSRRCLPDTEIKSCPTLHCLACADGESFEAPDWLPCRACHQPLGAGPGGECPHCGTPVRLPAGLKGGDLLAP